MPERAVIVVHGIGQHQPYEMARALTNGLQRIARAEGLSNVRVDQFVPPGQPDVPVPGRVYRYLNPDDMTYVDVYEAYWAPLVAGLTSFVGIVWWLLMNTFIPSRMVKRPNSKTLFDIGASAFCLGIIAVLYYWLLGAFLQATMDVLSPGPHPSPLHLVWDGWTAPTRLPLRVLSPESLGRVLSPRTLGLLLATAAGVYALFQIIFRVVEVVTDWPGFVRNWFVEVLILAAWTAIYLLARASVPPAFFAFGYVYVAFRVVNLGIRKYFVDYVGDIEVYVTGDSKSARFTAREQIRDRAVDAIKAAITRTEKYDEVLIFGHSLGSVIALDALREVRRQAGTVIPWDRFRQIKTFVTFGSPLEKTRFFFERLSPDDGTRWTEFLLDMRDTFLQQTGGQRHRIYWTNFWYFADLIGNSLESYNAVRSTDLYDGGLPDLVSSYLLPQPGRTPWVHSSYFVDTQFLEPTYRRLRTGPPMQPFPAYVQGRSGTIVIR